VTTSPCSNDPLHGITLEMILTQLVQQYGWPEFLRRTPWARKSVEELYLRSIAG
jgi:uncharacterized protein (DUF2132 family)